MSENHSFCHQCGVALEKDGQFCANCGTPIKKPPLPTRQDTSSLTWDFDIPLLNPFILQGVATAFGIPLLILLCFLGYSIMRSNTSFEKFMEYNGMGLYFAAILIGITILLTILFLAIVYKGKYCAQFTVNSQGASYKTRTDQRQVNRRINFFLIFAGLLSGKPGYAGTGLLAEASQSGSFPWSKLHRVTACPKKNVVILHDSWHKALILYCTPNNYEAVLHLAQMQVAQAEQTRQQETRTPNNRSFKWVGKLLLALLLLLAIIVVGLKAYDYFAPRKSTNYNMATEDYLQSSGQLNKSLEASILKSGNGEIITGNYDKAIENANAVIQINPKNANAYLIRGNGYYGKKDYTKALADYTRILELSPSSASAYYNRGLAYQALGNTVKAKEDFQQAATLGHEKAKGKLDSL